MNRVVSAVVFAVLVVASVVYAQRPAFEPITDKTMLNPSPDDWLMYSRTYDAQRFSPLAQITRANVTACRSMLRRKRPRRQRMRRSVRRYSQLWSKYLGAAMNAAPASAR